MGDVIDLNPRPIPRGTGLETLRRSDVETAHRLAGEELTRALRATADGAPATAARHRQQAETLQRLAAQAEDRVGCRSLAAALLPTLRALRAQVAAERDRIVEAATTPDGTFDDDEDRRAVARLDGLLRQADEAIGRLEGRA
jgi:hypothetical protein